MSDKAESHEEPKPPAPQRRKTSTGIVLALMCIYSFSFSTVTATPTHQKLGRNHDKFIFASTDVGNPGSAKDWLGNEGRIDLSPRVRKSLEKCIPLNLPVPEAYDPLPLCLKKQDIRKMAIHKDFRLSIDRKGQPPQELTLEDLMQGDRNLEGFVIGMGVSYVRGYIRDSSFYGTIAYRHLVRSQMMMCSVVPISLMGEFIDLSKMDDDEIEEFVARRTVVNSRGLTANAIVTCGDMHREDDDDVENPFLFKGKGNPTNVIQQTQHAASRDKRNAPDDPEDLPSDDLNEIQSSFREKRQAAPSTTEDSVSVSVSSTQDTIQGSTDKPVFNYGSPVATSELPFAGSEQKSNPARDRMNQLTYKNFFNPRKNGTYFATVCYLVDTAYVQRRYNGSIEELTLLLAGYVDLTDWILRATDWNQDGIPDNIGIRLKFVMGYDETIRQPGDIWGREAGGKFLLRNVGTKFMASGGSHLLPDCDIRTGIGEWNVAEYVISKLGGCTACESDHLSSFMNPYMDKFSPRGEHMRMLYKQIRLLSFSLVYTKGVCANCSDTNPRMRSDNLIGEGGFEGGDPNWGACIVEGDLQARSNIPLNSFRMSVCSIQEGARCLSQIANRSECMEFMQEESFCGNGIVEGDEECDCGTLATCAEQQCTCSPRSGMDPCRKLDGPDTQICFQLIKCRGFRFLYELGQLNNSHFMAGLPDVIDRARQEEVDSENHGMSVQNLELSLAGIIFLAVFLIA